jgi:hypothetical protein
LPSAKSGRALKLAPTTISRVDQISMLNGNGWSNNGHLGATDARDATMPVACSVNLPFAAEVRP